MKAVKETRRKRELAKGDIRVLRNQQASIMFKVNNYGKLGKCQRAAVDKQLSGEG